MSKLSVTEFKDLISDGAIVYCANREEYLEVIDFLQSLGFPLSETIMDFERTETYLSPGLNLGDMVISRYENRYIKNVLLKTQTPRTIIRFEQVPFKEFTKESSAEEFYECFTRFLLS